MTSAKKYERCAEVFGASKLLSTVCERFCYDSKAFTRDNKKRKEIEVGRETVESI